MIAVACNLPGHNSRRRWIIRHQEHATQTDARQAGKKRTGVAQFPAHAPQSCFAHPFANARPLSRARSPFSWIRITHSHHTANPKAFVVQQIATSQPNAMAGIPFLCEVGATSFSTSGERGHSPDAAFPFRRFSDFFLSIIQVVAQQAFPLRRQKESLQHRSFPLRAQTAFLQHRSFPLRANLEPKER